MSRMRIFLSRLRGLGRQRALERDLQDEIAAHLAEAADEYAQRGQTPDEARRAALRSFGGVTRAQEAHREMRSFTWLEDARRDMRYAIRALQRTPGFAAVAIVTLALATGAATVIFTVIEAALLRPLPYDKPEEIVSIDVGEAADRGLAPSAADIDDWRTADGVFARIGMGRVTGLAPTIVEAGGVPERLTVGTASEEFLEVFGIAPALGRAFTADDARPGAPRVVLLGHRYWQSRFNGVADVLGRSIVVAGEKATVIGVLPAGFYPDTVVWTPHVVSPPMRAMRGTGVPVYGRVRPGLDVDAAARDLTARLATAEGKPTLRVWLTPLYEEATRGYGRTIGVLSGAVVLIVLIACVNVAGLLLARGTTRLPELSIRKSIGASRGRLVRQLLTESAVLAVLGGIAGIVLTFVTLDAIVGVIPLQLPANVTPAVNTPVMAFALTLAMVTCVAFGLAPALKLSRTDFHPHLAGRARQSSALSRRGGQLLIAIEVAMALVLVTGAALMIRSFSKILAIDVGFEPAAIVTMEVVPVDTNPAAQAAYYAALLGNVRQIPGIAAAGAADRPPLDGSGSYTSATASGRSTSVALRAVMPGYFEAVGLPLRQGRYPTDADYGANPPFAVLSESAARAMFPDHSAIGQSFTLARKTWTVVGVVGNARNKSPLPDQRARPELYLAHAAAPRSPFASGLTVVVRPQGRIPDLADRLRHAALASGASVIVERIRSGRDWFGDRVATPRQRTTMLALLGGLGLLLTLVGIFGTTAYAVARRTQEVGIRMALGARAGQIVRAVVLDAAWPVAVGLAIGVAGAAAVTRVIETFLFDTAPTDPATFATTLLVLATTALAAAWIPARRTAHIDPVRALRAN